MLNLVSRRAWLSSQKLLLSPKEFSLLAELIRLFFGPIALGGALACLVVSWSRIPDALELGSNTLPRATEVAATLAESPLRRLKSADGGRLCKGCSGFQPPDREVWHYLTGVLARRCRRASHDRRGYFWHCEK